jgi:hypothetical protein
VHQTATAALGSHHWQILSQLQQQQQQGQWRPVALLLLQPPLLLLLLPSERGQLLSRSSSGGGGSSCCGNADSTLSLLTRLILLGGFHSPFAMMCQLMWYHHLSICKPSLPIHQQQPTPAAGPAHHHHWDRQHHPLHTGSLELQLLLLL